MGEIFDSITASPGREFLLRVAYLELYNEEIRDLLVGARQFRPSPVHVRKAGAINSIL